MKIGVPFEKPANAAPGLVRIWLNVGKSSGLEQAVQISAS